MNEYGFLALDIDGTVVNSKKEISPAVKAEINRIQEAGIPVALVSGRPTKGIEHIAAELNFDKYESYILAFNGGKIIECSTGKVVYNQTIPVALAKEVCRVAKEYNVPIVTYRDDEIVATEPENKYTKIEAHLTHMDVRGVESMEAEMDFDLSEASTYEPQITVTPDYPYGEGNGNPSPTISRADAIKSQETIIAGLKLNIAELSLNISKLEKKVNKKEVFSKIDGVVADLSSDSSVNADGAELLKIESDQGYFVTGTVSELLLDRMKEGLTLNCMSYETGEFEAVVTDVSEYPVSGNNYWGSGNPNVSYYTFSAEIPEQSLNHYNGEWINITMPIESESGNNLVISKAFVRSENGTSYVYKEVEGVLKKQVLAVGGNVDGGYSVLVTGGLSRNDKIAFPYGDSVFDGAKTREGTLDELYGY